MIPPVQVVVAGKLIGFVQGVVTPVGHQAVPAQVQAKRGQPVVVLAILLAVLQEDHQVVEHGAVLVTPRKRKSGIAGCLLVDILRIVVPVPASRLTMDTRPGQFHTDVATPAAAGPSSARCRGRRTSRCFTFFNPSSRESSPRNVGQPVLSIVGAGQSKGGEPRSARPGSPCW